MPVDFSETVLKAGMTAFAEKAQFIPEAGGVIVVSDPSWDGFGTSGGIDNLGRGVFDEGNRDLMFRAADELPTTTEIPTLGIRDADFMIMPVQDDQVVLRGTTYVVMEVLIDSHGGRRLKLQATT